MVEHLPENHHPDQALSLLNTFFRHIACHLSDMVFLLDAHGNIIDVNDSVVSQTQYSKDELLSMQIQEIDSGINIRDDKTNIWDVLESDNHILVEAIHRKKDASTYPVEITYSKIFYNEDCYVLALARNVTHNKLDLKFASETQAMFSSLFEQSKVGLEVYDRFGKLTKINPAACTIFGVVDAKEMIGFDLFTNPNLPADAIAKIKNGESFTYEFEFDFELVKKYHLYRTTRSGKAFLKWLIGPWHFENSEPEGYFVQILDITPRKLAEKVLLDSRKQWQTTFDAITDGITLLDVNGNIQQCNVAFEKLAGCERSEIVGQPCYRVMHNSDSRIDTCPFEEAMRTGLRKSSQVTLKNEIFEVCIDPVIDEEGKTTGAVHILQNITRRIEAEKSIIESEEKYRKLVNNSAEGIMIAQDGLFKFVNPQMCEMLKTTSENLLGKPFLKYIHPDDQILVSERYKKRLTGEEVPNEYHFRIIDSNDTIVWAYLKTTLIEWLGSPATLNMISDISESRETQEKLKESESALRMAQKTARMGSWSWHIQKNNLEWSDEMYSVFGIEKDNFNGLLSDVMQKAIHPDDIARVEASNRAVIEEGRPYPLEYRVLWPDGQIRTIYAEAGQLVRDEKGLPIILSGIAQDVTERKVAEMEVSKREHLLDRIFDILPVGLWIADENGKLIRSNAKGREIWGAEPLVDSDEYGVFKARRLPSGVEIAPDDWALAHTINRGVTIIDELLEIDALDGQKRIILNYTAPVRDENGTVEAAIIVNQDITKLQQISAQLKQSEEKFRIVAEKASDVVWLMDLRGRSLFVTPSVEKFTGFTQEEYLKQSIADRFTPSSAKEAAMALQNELNAYSYLKKVPKDFSKTLVLEYRCKDDSVKTGEVVITPYFDENDNLIGLHGVTRDVTDRIRINQELQELNLQLEEKVNQRTTELQSKNEELSRMNKLFVGRENRMLELKQQILELEEKLKNLET